MRSDWFRVQGRPLAEADLCRLEETVGFDLPMELRDLLLRTNGGRLKKARGPRSRVSALRQIYSVTDAAASDVLLADVWRCFNDDLPGRWLAVGDDSAGNQFCVRADSAAGEVWYFRADYGEWEPPAPRPESRDDLEFVAGSLAELFSLMEPREGQDSAT